MPLIRFKRKSKKVVVEERIGMHYYPNITDKDLRPTPIYPFYRKMRARDWKPLEKVLDVFKEEDKLRCRLVFRFKHERTNRILNIHISRHEQLYFTVAQGADVYSSPLCHNYNEFDEAFCAYFKRKRPVLPQKPGF